LVSIVFVTSVVGSFPRPKWLIEARRAFEEGRISREELREYEDDAVKVVVKEQEMVGVEVISDGEYRRFSFLGFVGEKVEGFSLVPVSRLAVSAEARSAIEAMSFPERAVRNPVVVGRISRPRPMALDELLFLKGVTSRAVKIALPSPYTIYWNAWHHELSKPYYPSPDAMIQDYIKVLRQEIAELFEKGADFVQLDEPAMGNLVEAGDDKPDRYKRLLTALNGIRYRGFRDELALAVDLINEAVKGFGGRIGVHICRGNWPAPEEYLIKGGYEKLMPAMLDMKAKQLVLEYATPRAGSIEAFKEYTWGGEIGLGVIDVKNPEVETPEVIVKRVERALRYFDPEKIWLNPDCGFASGLPWPVSTRNIALEKLRNMVKASGILRMRYRASER